MTHAILQAQFFMLNFYTHFIEQLHIEHSALLSRM